jgi:ABC-type cobalamin/Fe3+-siderophores transport system ATPase subunit
VSALIDVQHLGLATRTGPVFADVTFGIEQSCLTVVVGRSGSGRSALLLAACGRMRGLTGTIRLNSRPAQPRALRAVTSVARLASLVQPEAQLSVGESIVERALVDGVQSADADRAMATAEDVLQVTFDRSRLVDQLDAYDRALLCVALATIRPTELVVLDDADRGLGLDDQRRLLVALARLAAAGPAVLTSTTEPAAVPACAAVVRLGPQPVAAVAPPPVPTVLATPKKTA